MWQFATLDEEQVNSILGKTAYGDGVYDESKIKNKTDERKVCIFNNANDGKIQYNQNSYIE